MSEPGKAGDRALPGETVHPSSSRDDSPVGAPARLDNRATIEGVPSPLDLVSTVIGFGLIIVAGARMGAGSHLALGGLFPAQGRSDWPQGVQEGDAPRFAVEHSAALRPPASAEAPAMVELDDREVALPTLEPIELHVRRPAAHR